MATYLGVDLGTTATKAAVIDASGTVLARSRVTHPAARAGSRGRADPQAWRRSVAAACGALGSAADSVAAMGIVSLCPAALLLDAAGEPTTAAVTWDHPQLREHCTEVEPLWGPAHQDRIGNRLDPSTAMAISYRFFAECEPQALQRATTFGLVTTWLGRWLTGEWAVDPTQASYTGVFSLADGAWDWIPQAAAALGMPPGILPPIRPTLSVIGHLTPGAAAEIDVPQGIPVVVGGGDTPAGAYLMGVAPGGPALLTIGTTHVVTRSHSRPDPRGAALQRADIRPGQWLTHGVTNGGDGLTFGASLLSGMGIRGVRDVIQIAATADPGDTAMAPTFIGHVLPERGPLWLDSPVTAVLDLLPPTTVSAASLGVVEGVCFVDRMVIDYAVPADQPIVVATPSQSDPLLPQVFADYLGRELHVAEETHLSAVGAAAMCGEVLHGRRVPAPITAVVTPRNEWRIRVDDRWVRYRSVWESVVGRTALPPCAPATALRER